MDTYKLTYSIFMNDCSGGSVYISVGNIPSSLYGVTEASGEIMSVFKRGCISCGDGTDFVVKDEHKRDIINELSSHATVGEMCSCGNCFTCTCNSTLKELLKLYPEYAEAIIAGAHEASEAEDSTKEAIGMCRVEGNSIYLPKTQLSRDVYMAIKGVFEGWGGKYKKNTFVFKESPQRYIDTYLTDGKLVNLKKEYQFFPTPEPVGKRVVELAEITETDLVLEPEAGRGEVNSIAYHVPFKQNLKVIELNDLNRECLENQGYDVVGEDFLAYTEYEKYDKILMNPPFSKKQDVHHVLHALKCLKPGGTLVSVMSHSVTFATDTLTQGFRAYLDETGATIEPVDNGAFKESGTMVSTVIIKIVKPMTARAAVEATQTDTTTTHVPAHVPAHVSGADNHSHPRTPAATQLSLF